MQVKNPVHLKKPAWKRAIASTLAAALAVTGAAMIAAPAASAAPAATPPAGTQQIDAKLGYLCNIYVDQTKPIGTPTFPHQAIVSEIQTIVPSTVTPGEKIPATKVTLVNDFTQLVGDAHTIHAVTAIGGAPNLTSVFVVNNQSVTVPINNVKAPLAQIPADLPAPGQTTGFWLDTATGTSSPLTIPSNAAGTILMQGPQSVTIDANLSQNADGSNAFPTTLFCTADTGQDLTVGRISVIPAGSKTVDLTNNYLCDVYPLKASVPTDGTPPPPDDGGDLVTSELKATLPSAVTPGETIPATTVTDTVNTPNTVTAQLLGTDVVTSVDQIGTPDGSAAPALRVTQNGTTSASPLTNLTAASVTAPPNPPVLMPITSTTSPITVANNAQGSITIAAPRQFDLTFTFELPSENVAAPVAMRCTLADDDADATLATIKVIPPAQHASLTATSPKATAYGTAVKVPVTTGVPAPVAAKPAPAGGTQTIDAQVAYQCAYWINQATVPTDGTPPTNENGDGTGLVVDQELGQFQMTLPASVNPGATIPAGDLAMTLSLGNSSMPQELGTAVGGTVGGFDKASITDTALDANGTAVPLTAATTALTPAVAGGPTVINLTGSTSALTVPSGGSGDLTISAPAQLDFLFTAEPASTGTAVPVAEQCTPNDQGYVASVHVVRPLPKPAAAALPTGKVLITTAAGKGVAQGTLSKGKAIVSIPGTALPVGKSTLKVSYPGDSNTLNAPAKTITVVKTKTSPTLAVHVSPGKVAAGAVFPTVSVKLSGPGKAHGGKITVSTASFHKTVNLLALDGTGSVQLPPFAAAGHKLIRVSYAGNADFVAKTVTTGLNVTKTKLGKFVVKIKPGKIVAKKTRATLLITLGAPDKLNHGMVTVRLAGHVLAKKLIKGAGRITLPKFSSAGRKVLKLTFTGNGSVVAKTVTKAVKVTKRR